MVGSGDFERAAKELTRALHAERIDALSGHLVLVHCLAGNWQLAAQELAAHVRAQPRGVNAWRRIAEFRNALARQPLAVLVDSASVPRAPAHFLGHGAAACMQSQAATQPLGGEDEEEQGEQGEEAAARREAEEEVAAVLGEFPLALAVVRWLEVDKVAMHALAALQVFAGEGKVEQRQLLAALGDALDVLKGDAQLLAVLEEELAASSCADIAPDADEWRARRGWWPRYHGAAARDVSALLAALLCQLR